MNVEKLKELFEKSGDKYRDAKHIGTTYQTLYNLIYKGSNCKVDLLEKIAAFYKVPVGYFFDEVSLAEDTHPPTEMPSIDTTESFSGTQSANSTVFSTQRDFGYTNFQLWEENVSRLTQMASTLTKELEASSQQKNNLIAVVATSQERIQQLTNIIDRLTQ